VKVALKLPGGVFTDERRFRFWLNPEKLAFRTRAAYKGGGDTARGGRDTRPALQGGSAPVDPVGKGAVVGPFRVARAPPAPPPYSGAAAG
jgi:hypothetical protein